MDDESISVAPSDDNGNTPIMEETVETPSEPTETEVTTEKEPETPAEPVVELFELPDGRKVDAVTLSKEWKENFLPDYTRKSQALAVKEKPLEEPTSKFADPTYTPGTYEEIIQAAEERALKTIEGRETARIEQAKAIETAVETQLAEVRKADPTFNENALFLHANKYGFRDLKQAHQNMKDMSDLAKSVKQTTAKDIAKRTDPVSVSPGATGARPEPSQFATSRDYLNAVKASGK